MSTLNRKAWGDLTRHRPRTLLAVCTLSIAIASLGFLAVPALLNAAMNRQIAGSHLYDVGIFTSTLDLSPAQLGALGRLPGVAAVSPAVGYATTAASAAGPQDVELAGTALASAPVNTVALFTGQMPGPGEVLADAGNARATGFAIPSGGTIDVRAAGGRLVRLRVSGTGMNLAATPGANGSTTPVFYAQTATVQALRGVRGYNYLGFRLTHDAAAAQSRVVAEVRAYLTAQTGADPITALPAVRAPGQWPGQSGFNQIMALLYIITILAFASALFLISATMNTLVAEQASEIAILKTLGGRRRQIAGITVRTAAMLGAAAAVLGSILGIAIAYLLAGYFAVKLIDVSFGFAISVPVVVASLVLGPALAVAASVPALRRALGQPVAETLARAVTSGYGSGWLDRLVARSGLLAGAGVPGSVRMGVRNALRQKRRSAATIAQVAVAAGLAIAFLALGQSITAVISQTIGKLHFSIGVGVASTRGARPFGSQALAVAATTPGITGAEPVETSSVQYNGQTYVAWGLGAHPLYSYRLSAGHWFTTAHTAADAGTAIPPVVLGPALARAARASVGQILTLSVAAGPTRVRVIGIDTVPTNNGDTVYFPLPVLERLDGGPGTANSIWLTTASTAHTAIDRAATAAANRLAAAGYPVSTTEIYITEAQITAADTAILTIVDILGLVVVAIMLMGLVSTLSMGVIERTREVGILRCVGARARQIRRVFSAEAVVLAVAGWAFGVLLGWLIYQGLLTLLLHDASISLPQEFPPVIPLVTLAGVVVLTVIVIRGPLRRATRIEPGTALRYQ
ncbi:MAG: transporter permease [Actinomycetia bacterium]|nr:transporter permease [Actinomycetes bacterium]